MEVTPDIPGFGDLAPIGSGGFSRVFKATQVGVGRTVAVKVLFGTVHDDGSRGRFEREARAAGHLSDHPNVVPLHANGVTADGHPYLVLDYLPGGSLGERLRRSGAMAVGEVVNIGAKLAGALETAHRAGILHRDVKPDNVLMSRYGEPQLTDFGIASVVGGYETRSGVLSLSLGHAPPEVIGATPGFRPGPPSDIYSLGSSLFNLLTGELPFPQREGELLPSLLGRIVTEPIPDLRVRGVPDPIARVIEKAMAKDPADRYQRVVELGNALVEAGLLAGITVSPPLVESVTPVSGVGWSTGPQPVVSAPSAGAPVTGPTGPKPNTSSTVAVPVFTPSTIESTVDAPGRPRRRGLVAALLVVALLGGGAAAVALTRDDDSTDDGGEESAGSTTSLENGTDTSGGPTTTAALGSGSGRPTTPVVTVNGPVFVGEPAALSVSAVSGDDVAWDLGGGLSGTGRSTTATFAEAGDREIMVMVGGLEPITHRVTVYERPQAAFTVVGGVAQGDRTVIAPGLVTFENASTGVIDGVVYEWLVDDVPIAEVEHLQHQFSAAVPREHTVTLRVRHDALDATYGTTGAFSDDVSVSITVFPGLPAPPSNSTSTSRPPSSSGSTTSTSVAPVVPDPGIPDSTTSTSTTTTAPPATVAPQMATVPNVQGRPRSEAISLVQQAGFDFVPSSTTNCGSTPQDSVVSQSPAGGLHPVTTLVTLTFCSA